jgi:hypothetical protein
LNAVELQEEDSHHRVTEGTEESCFVCRRDTDRQNGLPQKDLASWPPEAEIVSGESASPDSPEKY